MKIGSEWQGYKTVVIRGIDSKGWIIYSNLGSDTRYKFNEQFFREIFPIKVKDGI